MARLPVVLVCCLSLGLWTCDQTSPINPAFEEAESVSLKTPLDAAETEIIVSTITQQFNGSGGLSLDAEGNLYIGDFGDFLSAGDADNQPNHVWKLDQAGNLTIYARGFVGASGNAFNSEGILYQSDIGANGIYRILNNTRVLFTNTGINAPVGLVFDPDDNLYVANCGNNTIRKVTPDGTSTLFSNSGLFRCPNGITIDPDGNLYVSNFSNSNVIKLTPAGQASIFVSIPGNNNGHLRYFVPDSMLYVCSHGSSRIYTVDMDRNVQVLAGSGTRGNQDGTAAQATFSRPNGIAISATGDTLYINSSIPLTNTPNFPLNPSVIRMITGVNPTPIATEDPTLGPNDFSFTIEGNDLKITLKIVRTRSVRLAIYDTTGRQLRTQDWPHLAANTHHLHTDLTGWARGTYTATLHSEKTLLKSFTINL